MNRFAFVAPLAAVVLLGAALMAQAEPLTSTPLPAAKPANTHYVGNRDPLAPSRLVKLPPGAVKPAGWLRGQLDLEAAGMIGRLQELSPWCKFEGNSWTSPTGEGHSPWEELPYWFKGYADLAYVLGDAKLIADTRRWIDAIIAGQQPDGWFGPKANRTENDQWPNMVMLFALRSHYEATGDQRVIDLMTRYFKYVGQLPRDKFFVWDGTYGRGWWQMIRGGDNLDSIHWLYNHTGDKSLLELARRNHQVTGNWTVGFPSWHGVNIAQCFREPAQFWQQEGKLPLLDATKARYEEVIGRYGQVPGGLFASDENCREGFHGPRQGTEACTMVEMMQSHEMLLRITGEALWADRCEDVTFNSLPASMTPDHRGLHYLTAPNQPQLDRANKAPMIQNAGDMMTYTPYEQYRCCQHNVSHGWPYFTGHLWLATAGNGLAAAMYAPSSVTAKVADGVEVTITEQTDYPFGETVELTIKAARKAAWPLVLRIPGWCNQAAVKVNGKPVEPGPAAGAWATIEREWSDGDKVSLQLPMEIRLRIWQRTGGSTSVSRGPLSYSLKIEEDWRKYDNGKPWAAHEVFPKSDWNYGLLVDDQNPTVSFKFKPAAGPVASQPFTPQAAPVSLTARGQKIPKWGLEKNGMIEEIQQSPAIGDGEPQELTLIPMGCARLRVSSFPRIGTPPAARQWIDHLPTPPAIVPTNIAPGTRVLAIVDGAVPEKSADTKTPRFAWWPNKPGTTEHIDWAFAEPATLSSFEVFWAEDGQRGVLLPAGWELLSHQNGKWQPVKAKGAYPLERDRFCRVEFEPQTSTRWQLSVKMPQGGTAGIFEIRESAEETARRNAMHIRLTSTAFEDGQPIPRRHTEDGQNLSPALAWTGIPAGTRELALLVDDPDAPRPQPWVHWVIYKIPPDASGLPQALSPSERVPQPPGAIQGRNSWDRTGWGGPSPPKGHGVHHYRFHLYALDAPLALAPGATKDQLLAAIMGHTLAEATLTGTYERK